MKVFNLPYRLGEEDYLKFNDHFLQYTPLGKKTLSTYRLILPIVAAIFYLFILYFSRDPIVLIAEAVVLSILSLIWFLCARKILLKSIQKRVKRSKAGDPVLFSPAGEIVFDFENRSLTDIDEKTETKIRFESISVCYRTEDAFYFYFQPARAVILPYRCFSDRAEMDEFFHLVSTYFPVRYES